MITVIGRIGDMNPLDHGGGVILRDDGYDPPAYSIEYTPGVEGVEVYAQDESAARLELYVVPIDDGDPRKGDLDWVKWDEVSRCVGVDMDEIDRLATGRGAGEPVAMKAGLYEMAAMYHGWGELDPEPEILSYAALEKRWFPEDAIDPAPYEEQVKGTGKFEREKPHVPYFYALALDTGADEEASPDETGGDWIGIFTVTERERVAFPSLAGVKEIAIAEGSEGFVVEVEIAEARSILDAAGENSSNEDEKNDPAREKGQPET